MDNPRIEACAFIVVGILGYFGGRKEKARERLRVADALGEVVKVETSRWRRWNSEDGSPVSIGFSPKPASNRHSPLRPTRNTRSGIPSQSSTSPYILTTQDCRVVGLLILGFGS